MPTPRPRILADCTPGEIVTLDYSGQEVTIETVTPGRVRIRPTGRQPNHTFVDAEGIEHVISARFPARDVAPSVPLR